MTNLRQTLQTSTMALVLAISFIGSASAALITYEFDGIVADDEASDLSDGLFGPGIFEGKDPGDSFSGSVTLDTDGVLVGSDSESASYTGAFDVTIDGTSYGSTLFTVSKFVGADLFVLNFGTYGHFVMVGPEGTLPTFDVPTSLSLPDFSLGAQAQWIVEDTYVDFGDLTSLTIVDSPDGVPAPGAIVLFGIGLLGLRLKRHT